MGRLVALPSNIQISKPVSCHGAKRNETTIKTLFRLSESVDREMRESNILYFLKEIGMNHKKREKKDLSLTLTTNLKYEEAKPQLETYRAAILGDDSQSVDLVDKKGR